MYFISIKRVVDDEVRHATLDFNEFASLMQFIEFIDSCVGFDSIIISTKKGDCFDGE